MSTSRDHVEILDITSNFSADEIEIIEKDGEVELDRNMPKKGHTISSSYVEPYVGLEFDNVEDAFSCYKAFSRRTGFSIRTNHIRFSSIDKSLVAVDYECSREGYRRYNLKRKERVRPEAPETRCWCKAMIQIKKNEGKWVVSKFILHHNHELLTPKSPILLRGYRRMTPAQKNLIDKLNDSGIPPRKIMSVLSKEHGGDYNIGCIPKNIHNYLGSQRKQVLEKGDAQKLYEYFLERECNQPSFVYSIQFDAEGSMGNCFWVDGRSRVTYQYFGDVVTFDATYLTNRYKMPFVLFTGVNHYHQSVMFGYALLINETIESYTWLFKTWLEAMLGRAPTTVIIDDDKSMVKTIQMVMPNTTHKLCLWHLLQKVLEHIAHVYHRYPKFKFDFNHCIHDTLTIEEFEFEWTALLSMYNLKENSWLQTIYAKRKKLVPAYLRSTFCVGMSTTQRSESMNKFCKNYVQSSSMVSEFVHQYEKALNARYQSEKEQDVRTKTSMPIIITSYRIEAEVAKLYTLKSFSIFQKELTESQKFQLHKTREEDGCKIYLVSIPGIEKWAYEVKFSMEKDVVSCTCHKFEFMGFLCQYILQFLTRKNCLDLVKQSYVLERWTMNAKKSIVHEICVDKGLLETIPTTFDKKHRLMRQFYPVFEMGSLSTKKYEHVSWRVESIHQELLLMSDDDDDGGNTEGHAIQNQLLSNIPLQDLPIIIGKGRLKTLRQKNSKENMLIKKRRCNICK